VRPSVPAAIAGRRQATAGHPDEVLENPSPREEVQRVKWRKMGAQFLPRPKRTVQPKRCHIDCRTRGVV